MCFLRGDKYASNKWNNNEVIDEIERERKKMYDILGGLWEDIQLPGLQFFVLQYKNVELLWKMDNIDV